MSQFVANFPFLLFAIAYANFTGPDRTKNIPDWYLDVAIMLDQSQDMTQNHFRDAYEDVANWMNSLYDGNNTEARFAVIYCCQLPTIGGVKHYFSQGDFKTAVPPLLKAATYDAICEVNWDGCMKMVREEVFHDNHGSRENATKIAMFISVCEFTMKGTVGGHDYAVEATHFHNLFNKNDNGKLVFVCVSRGDNSWQLSYIGKMLDMINLNKQVPADEATIFNRRYLNFSDSIDFILPSREADIFDCKTATYCSENCMMSDPNASSCFKVCNVTVIQMPHPRKYAKPCHQLNAKDTECECLTSSEINTKTTVAHADTVTIVSISLACVLGLLLLTIIIVAMVIEWRRKKTVKQHHLSGVWADDKITAKVKKPTQWRKTVRKPGPAIASSSSLPKKLVWKASKTKKTTTKRGKNVPKQSVQTKLFSKTKKTATIGGKIVSKQSVHAKSVSKPSTTKKTAATGGKRVPKQLVKAKAVSKASKTKKTTTIGGSSVPKHSVQVKAVSTTLENKKTATIGGKSVPEQSIQAKFVSGFEIGKAEKIESSKRQALEES